MKKIQPIKIKGSDITVYIEVEDVEETDNFSERIQENIPAGKKDTKKMKNTSAKVIELTTDVILAPAYFFAKQLHNTIEKMENKPEKAKIEFYTKIVLGTDGILNIITNLKGEASMKVILEWDIEQKK